MKDELLPCPFCGSVAEMQEGEKGQAGCFEFIYDVECSECLCRTYYWKDTEDEAITAWNTRAPDPRIAALEAERDALRSVVHQAIEWDGYDAEGQPAVWLDEARKALGETHD